MHVGSDCVSVWQVNIWVPQPEKQLDLIKVTGLVANVERAKVGLLERVKELQAEQEDRVRNREGTILAVLPKRSLAQLGFSPSQNFTKKKKGACCVSGAD